MSTERVKKKYQKRRREFIDAAAKVFAEKGYHGATTTDIADHLDVTQGNLYYYFKSKDDALTQVCNTGTEGYLVRLNAILDIPLPSADKLQAAILAHIEPAATIPSYAMSFLREKRYLSGAAKRDVYDLTDEYNARFETILTTGIENGEFKSLIDTKLHALMIIHACNGALAMAAGDPKIKIPKISRQIANMFLQGLST